MQSTDVIIIGAGMAGASAAYFLAPHLRVVLLSVTEGEDKPLKYPVIFHDAGLVIITKTDLAAAVDFNRETALANIQRVAPGARVLELSSKTGHGMQPWYELLEKSAKGL